MALFHKSNQIILPIFPFEPKKLRTSHLLVFWICFILVHVTSGTFVVSQNRVRLSASPVGANLAPNFTYCLDCLAYDDYDNRLSNVWLFNNKPLQTSINGSEIFNGQPRQWKLAPNGSLIIQNFGLMHAGMYRCSILAEKYGVVLSLEAKLGLIEQPTIVLTPQNLTISVGHLAKFDCQVSGSPPLNVTWFKNGALIEKTPHATRFIQSPHNSLYIENVWKGDTGFYICQVQNAVASKRAGAYLTISHDPPIELSNLPIKVVRPKYRTVKALRGQDAFLECSSTLNVERMMKNSKIEWSRSDGFRLPSKRSQFLASNSILVLNQVDLADQHFYTCSIRDEKSKRIFAENQILLTVEYEPKFVDKPVEMTKRRGETVRLFCTVDSYPPPNITWYRDGEMIRPYGRMKIFPTPDQTPEWTFDPEGVGDDLMHFRRELVISSIKQDQDAGLYQCVAENSRGQATAAAVLFVEQLKETDMDAPRNFTVSVSHPLQLIELQWTIPELHLNHPETMPEFYFAHFYAVYDKDFSVENTEAFSSVDHCFANGSCRVFCCSNSRLKPAAKYVFWVSGVDSTGTYTAPTLEFEIDTWDETAVAGVVPISVEISSQIHKNTTGSIVIALISWETPQRSHLRGHLNGYVLQLNEETSSILKRNVQEFFINHNSTSYFLTNLKPQTFYNLRLIPLTKSGKPRNDLLIDSHGDFPYLNFHVGHDDYRKFVDKIQADSYCKVLLSKINASTLELKILMQNLNFTQNFSSNCEIKLLNSDGGRILDRKSISAMINKESNVLLQAENPGRFVQLFVICPAFAIFYTKLFRYGKLSIIDGQNTLISVDSDNNYKSDAKVDSTGGISSDNDQTVDRAVFGGFLSSVFKRRLTPAPPYDVECYIDTHQRRIGLRWRHVTSSGDNTRASTADWAVSNFNVRYGSKADTSGSKAIKQTTQDFVTFKNLIKNSTYIFNVQTVMRDGKKSDFTEDLPCVVPMKLESPDLTPPPIVRAVFIDNVSIQVTWEFVEGHIRADIKTYIRLKRISTDNGPVTWQELEGSSTGDYIIISHLVAGNSYEIRVVCEDQHGFRGAPSDPVIIFLDPQKSTNTKSSNQRISSWKQKLSDNAAEIVKNSSPSSFSYVEGLAVGVALAFSSILLCISFLVCKSGFDRRRRSRSNVPTRPSSSRRSLNNNDGTLIGLRRYLPTFDLLFCTTKTKRRQNDVITSQANYLSMSFPFLPQHQIAVEKLPIECTTFDVRNNLEAESQLADSVELMPYCFNGYDNALPSFSLPDGKPVIETLENLRYTLKIEIEHSADASAEESSQLSSAPSMVSPGSQAIDCPTVTAGVNGVDDSTCGSALYESAYYSNPDVRDLTQKTPTLPPKVFRHYCSSTDDGYCSLAPAI